MSVGLTWVLHAVSFFNIIEWSFHAIAHHIMQRYGPFYLISIVLFDMSLILIQRYLLRSIFDYTIYININSYSFCSQVVSNTTDPVPKLSSSTTTKVANNMTTSSISVSSSKNNLVLYHQQTINGPSMQDRHFTQSVTSKTYKMKGNENDIYKSAAIPNGSPSNSPTVNNRNHISNPTNPLGTPTFRRSSTTGGDRNRGSMRKMLPALPDMDTQVIHDKHFKFSYKCPFYCVY